MSPNKLLLREETRDAEGLECPDVPLSVCLLVFGFDTTFNRAC